MIIIRSNNDRKITIEIEDEDSPELIEIVNYEINKLIYMERAFAQGGLK